MSAGFRKLGSSTKSRYQYPLYPLGGSTHPEVLPRSTSTLQLDAKCEEGKYSNQSVWKSCLGTRSEPKNTCFVDDFSSHRNNGQQVLRSVSTTDSTFDPVQCGNSWKKGEFSLYPGTKRPFAINNLPMGQCL